MTDVATCTRGSVTCQAQYSVGSFIIRVITVTIICKIQCVKRRHGLVDGHGGLRRLRCSALRYSGFQALGLQHRRSCFGGSCYTRTTLRFCGGLAGNWLQRRQVIIIIVIVVFVTRAVVRNAIIAATSPASVPSCRATCISTITRMDCFQPAARKTGRIAGNPKRCPPDNTPCQQLSSAFREATRVRRIQYI